MTIKKILVELEYEAEENENGAVASFSHPDLHGEMGLAAGSLNLLEVQIEHLNLAKPESGDPFSLILSSANKLAIGVSDVIDVLKS